MSDLAAYQRHVATALGTAEPTDLRGADVSRWSVQQWAAALLRNVCPLTGRLLVLRGRYGADVDAHLARGGRPSSLHAWGRAFLAGSRARSRPGGGRRRPARAGDDRPGRGTVPPCPSPGSGTATPGRWSPRSPQGRDPVELPHAELPVLVYREPGGRLATAFAG